MLPVHFGTIKLIVKNCSHCCKAFWLQCLSDEAKTCSQTSIKACMLHSRCFVVGACDLPTGESTSSTFSTLIHPLVGSNHLVAACLHTLALDTH